MINYQQAKEIAKEVNLNTRTIPIKEFQYALNVELEHQDITDGDIYLTVCIVMAHLSEYPDYYERLQKMESEATAYWKNRKKPEIFF